MCPVLVAAIAAPREAVLLAREQPQEGARERYPEPKLVVRVCGGRDGRAGSGRGARKVKALLLQEQSVLQREELRVCALRGERGGQIDSTPAVLCPLLNRVPRQPGCGRVQRVAAKF